MVAGGGIQLAAGTYPIRSFCILYFVFPYFSFLHSLRSSPTEPTLPPHTFPFSPLFQTTEGFKLP